MKPALTLLPNRYAVARLETQTGIPDWAMAGDFWAVVRTADELSLVCPESLVPVGTRCESHWRLLKVAGPLDFSLVGVLAGLAGTLAEAEVSIFVISTFDTDYLLVRHKQVETALVALRQRGYPVESGPDSYEKP
jgi:hypothetical protein